MSYYYNIKSAVCKGLKANSLKEFKVELTKHAQSAINKGKFVQATTHCDTIRAMYESSEVDSFNALYLDECGICFDFDFIYDSGFYNIGAIREDILNTLRVAQIPYAATSSIRGGLHVFFLADKPQTILALFKNYGQEGKNNASIKTAFIGLNAIEIYKGIDRTAEGKSTGAQYILEGSSLEPIADQPYYIEDIDDGRITQKHIPHIVKWLETFGGSKPTQTSSKTTVSTTTEEDSYHEEMMHEAAQQIKTLTEEELAEAALTNPLNQALKDFVNLWHEYTASNDYEKFEEMRHIFVNRIATSGTRIIGGQYDGQSLQFTLANNEVEVPLQSDDMFRGKTLISLYGSIKARCVYDSLLIHEFFVVVNQWLFDEPMEEQAFDRQFSQKRIVHDQRQFPDFRQILQKAYGQEAILESDVYLIPPLRRSASPHIAYMEATQPDKYGIVNYKGCMLTSPEIVAEVLRADPIYIFKYFKTTKQTETLQMSDVESFEDDTLAQMLPAKNIDTNRIRMLNISTSPSMQLKEGPALQLQKFHNAYKLRLDLSNSQYHSRVRGYKSLNNLEHCNLDALFEGSQIDYTNPKKLSSFETLHLLREVFKQKTSLLWKVMDNVSNEQWQYLLPLFISFKNSVLHGDSCKYLYTITGPAAVGKTLFTQTFLAKFFNTDILKLSMSDEDMPTSISLYSQPEVRLSYPIYKKSLNAFLKQDSFAYHVESAALFIDEIGKEDTSDDQVQKMLTEFANRVKELISGSKYIAVNKKNVAETVVEVATTMIVLTANKLTEAQTDIFDRRSVTLEASEKHDLRHMSYSNVQVESMAEDEMDILTNILFNTELFERACSHLDLSAPETWRAQEMVEEDFADAGVEDYVEHFTQILRQAYRRNNAHNKREMSTLFLKMLFSPEGPFAASRALMAYSTAYRILTADTPARERPKQWSIIENMQPMKALMSKIAHVDLVKYRKPSLKYLRDSFFEELDSPAFNDLPTSAKTHIKTLIKGPLLTQLSHVLAPHIGKRPMSTLFLELDVADFSYVFEWIGQLPPPPDGDDLPRPEPEPEPKPKSKPGPKSKSKPKPETPKQVEITVEEAHEIPVDVEPTATPPPQAPPTHGGSEVVMPEVVRQLFARRLNGDISKPPPDD